MLLEFALPIVPTPQARPRVAVRFGHGVAYKTARQKANERTLEAMLAPHRPAAPIAAPLALEVTAVLPIPKSAAKKAREDMAAGKLWPGKKPDLDNLLKNLLDAMTRLRFWTDDALVCSIRADKRYGVNPCWKVGIWTPEFFESLQEGMRRKNDRPAEE